MFLSFSHVLQNKLREQGDLLMFQLGFDSEAFGLFFFLGLQSQSVSSGGRQKHTRDGAEVSGQSGAILHRSQLQQRQDATGVSFRDNVRGKSLNSIV